MFTIVIYAVGCGIIAAILTVFANLFKPIHKKGDSKPWIAMFTFFAIAFAAPYAYTEGLTHLYGDKMRSAVQDAFESTDVQGPMRYFRVIGYRPNKEASVYAVGLERESWGGTDRPIVSMHLVKDGEGWKADSYRIVYSARLNKDGFTFPPYW